MGTTFNYHFNNELDMAGRYKCPNCGSTESIKFPMSSDPRDKTRACKKCGTPFDPSKEYSDEEKYQRGQWGLTNFRIADSFWGKKKRNHDDFFG